MLSYTCNDGDIFTSNDSNQITIYLSKYQTLGKLQVIAKSIHNHYGFFIYKQVSASVLATGFTALATLNPMRDLCGKCNKEWAIIGLPQ